ncbi:phosphodiesterase, MJ0936 family protein [Natrinema pellirubrum DSM 15624]|uniref:Phosphoesterase n=1 Tax=Natrinema pellirubrum (strain DSM 15624 / CIP 106293 / JCM 10476 / NCIMB 786 / 157) TaxID=797303 RepID=L0JIF0_NATP1|nr:metallophosphoesterase [Natrinema pellirubrum]AGB30121.1 phosphoesterase, MJ0936 family [Natrinema pellirubrum DSM 15624]ELY69825.1 phosphodiesterase, MJ0936 family protein [Natrinema pellirubrum DSM 15624]ELZ15782.1 phosphodiesterase, MJ0936 family protein [Natrinema thermotolerans DSM 11552]
MHIGIVSDTHDNVEAIERATEIFAEEGVEIVVHCGDFVAPLMVDYFEGFELHGVLGNNDGDVRNLQRAFDSLGGESQLHGRFADLEFDGLSFAVLHGESKAEVDAIAAGDGYDFVCYGHHHERELSADGRTTVLNPGAHVLAADDDRTVAIVDTRSQSVRFRSLLE